MPSPPPPPSPELFPWMMWILIKLALILSSIVQEKFIQISISQFQQQQELTVDDIEDFDDDDDLDEVDSRRYSRRVLDDAVDLVLGLSSFATGCNLFAF
ncbi:hypothetical protein KY290_027834 [Solanum tuberosum]|uniref:Uncharacterized protein n=1 Tax=Solanum tuberosum TaxID=4113 RepID=A0ABQ7UG96_SOLTU|nr:hypothetical protein KY290_027834 [Solanum tuberosum]